jgi:hypothetical protein
MKFARFPAVSHGPAFEGPQLLAGCSVDEAKFGLPEKEVKVGFRNAIVSAERSPGLVPEVLNSVDVIVAFENVGVRVVDPVAMELGDVEDLIGGIRVGIDDRIRNDLLPDDGKGAVSLRTSGSSRW